MGVHAAALLEAATALTARAVVVVVSGYVMAGSVVTRLAGTVRPVSVSGSVGAVPPASLFGSLPVIVHFSSPSIQ